MDRPALWLLLKARGIPQKLIDLMEDLFTNTVSCVHADGVQSDWFLFSAGVRQDCNMAPDLFLEPMDGIMDRTVHRRFAGISIGSQVFTDLDFADDVALLLYSQRCWRYSSSHWKFCIMRHIHFISRLTAIKPRSRDPIPTRPIPRQYLSWATLLSWWNLSRT